MKDPRNLLLVVLVVLLAFLAGQSLSPEDALGQGYPGGTADSNGQMIAVTGTIGSGVSVLWIVDTERRQLAIYQCMGGKSVELVAARKIEWDLKIENFRDESLYTPEQLRKIYLSQPRGGTELPERNRSRPAGASGDAGRGSSTEESEEGQSAEER